MIQYWEPGTQYNYGDVVQFEGHKYKIIQPHRSQSDWAPNVTPALWGKLQDGDSGDSGHSARQEYQPQYQGQQQQEPYQQPAPQYGGNDEKQSESHHGKLDGAKQWAQEHKQGLEIAGGVAAVAGLAAAGTAAYKHHQQPQQHEQEQSYQPQYNQSQPNHPSKVEEAKHWAQEHKTGLGLAAGAAVLGGGLLAYKHHQHEKEQEQRDD